MAKVPLEQPLLARHESREGWDTNDADSVWILVQDFAGTFAPKQEPFDRTFRSLLQVPQTLILVSEHRDGSVVGYLLAHCRSTFLANGPVAWGEEVMVAEQVRRQGAGQALMTEAESWAREQGAAYISLASRRAGEFYRSLAYEDAATFSKKSL